LVGESDQEEEGLMQNPVALIGDFSKRTTPDMLRWLGQSKIMAVGWLAMRFWLGIMWAQAGWSKLWGAENAYFLHNHGVGVASFASHGVPAYSWWGSFLLDFVVPNASWIGVLVAVAEFCVGIALVLGLFTRLAALGSLVLLFTYVMSGTASVCAFYGLFAIVILATWRTSSWIGVDGLVAGYRQRHHHPRLSPQKSDLTGKRKMRAVLVSRLVDATKGLRGEEIHWFPAHR
jgi:thiosulfate dehydrogenase [quinone] large subunit